MDLSKKCLVLLDLHTTIFFMQSMIDKGEIKEEDKVDLFEKRKMWVPRKTLLQRRGHDKTD